MVSEVIKMHKLTYSEDLEYPVHHFVVTLLNQTLIDSVLDARSPFDLGCLGRYNTGRDISDSRN